MNRVRLSVRSLAVTVVGLMAAATLIVPASAHVNSPLTFSHLKRHFYTKGQSNARFINVGETATNADKLDGLDSTALQATVVSGFKDGPVALPGSSLLTVGTLSVPAGKYLATAKAWLNNTSATTVLVDCRLTAGANFDEAKEQLEAAGTNAQAGTVAFQVTNTFAAAGTITLACNDFGVNDVQVNFIKITALKVDNLSNAALP